MTVYLKDENGFLISAQNGYNGVIGLADSPELCLANGFFAADETEYARYLAGQMTYANQVFTDITSTPEYIAEQESKTKEAQRVELLTQINELEKSQTRAIREVALGKSVDFAMGKLQTIDEQISKLRNLL